MSKFKSGDKCAICNKEWKPKTMFAHHHVSYPDDLTVILCYPCHTLLHGSAKVYRHPCAVHGKDKAPWEFAKRVILAYKKAYQEMDIDIMWEDQ
jgi:hypothetical protein